VCVRVAMHACPRACSQCPLCGAVFTHGTAASLWHRRGMSTNKRRGRTPWQLRRCWRFPPQRRPSRQRHHLWIPSIPTLCQPTAVASLCSLPLPPAVAGVVAAAAGPASTTAAAAASVAAGGVSASHGVPKSIASKRKVRCGVAQRCVTLCGAVSRARCASVRSGPTVHARALAWFGVTRNAPPARHTDTV
jgi:hypothetical protein